MSAVPTPNLAPPADEPRSNAQNGQTIMAFAASLLLHTVLLAVMAAITWVVVHDNDRDVVLEFGGGGGGGGSPGGGQGVSSAGAGNPGGQAQADSAIAAIQMPTAPAPSMEGLSDLALINAPMPDASGLAVSANADPALSAFGTSTGGFGVSTGMGSGTGSGVGPGDGSGTGGGSGSGAGPGVGAGVGPGLNGLLGDMRRRGLDVVFVIDATDSMAPYIGQSKERLREIVSVVTSLISGADTGQPNSKKDFIRFGLVAFKDYGDEYGIEATKAVPISAEISSLEKTLNDVVAGGGADYPEPLHEALRVATAKNMGWNKQRKNVIILVTDTSCHSLGRKMALQEAQQFVKQFAGQINVIDVGQEEKTMDDGRIIPPRETVLPDLLNIAKSGGGSAFLLREEKLFWRHLIVSIFGQRYEQDIEQIINRYAKPAAK